MCVVIKYFNLGATSRNYRATLRKTTLPLTTITLSDSEYIVIYIVEFVRFRYDCNFNLIVFVDSSLCLEPIYRLYYQNFPRTPGLQTEC